MKKDSRLELGSASIEPPEKFAGLMANPTMSRRGFFSLAAVVGALAFLGSVRMPGGTVVSAWADEDAKIHFTIYILGRDELPVLCFDVSDDDNKKPLAGMSVTITSLLDGNTNSVTSVSNVDGFAPVHIKALSRQADSDMESSYDFYGSVVASLDGYRAFHHPKTFLSTGASSSSDGSHSNTLEIPTHPVTGNSIYLRTAALDDADVQYCTEGCGVGPENTIQHTFEVEVIAPAGSSIDVKVVLVAPNGAEDVWGEDTLSAESSDPTSYCAVFTGAWLKNAVAGSMLKVKFGKQGGTTYVMTSQVKFVDQVSALSDAIGSATVQPGQSSNGTPDICPIPKWIMRTGDTFSCAFPAVPIKLFSDNKANFGIAVTLASVAFLKSVNGEDQLQDADSIKHIFGGQGVQKAWNSYKNDVYSSLDNYQNSMQNGRQNKGFGRTPFTSKLDASFQLQFMAYFGWKADEENNSHYWIGDAAIAVDLGIACSWTQQFTFGVVPLYVVFDLAADVTAKMLLGMKFNDGFKNVEWGHSNGKVPVAIVVVVHVEAGFAVAIGVAGIAGAGVRGSAYMHFEFTFDKVEGKKYPHITATLAAKLEAFVQLFFLKKTWTLVHTPEYNIADNWGSNANSLESSMSAAALASAYRPGSMDDATVVTADELAFAAEYQVVMKPVAAEGVSPMGLEDGSSGSVDYVMEYHRIEKGSSALRLMSADETPSFEDPYDSSGATSYNLLRGLKPTYVNKLFEDGYSNSRLKVTHGYSGYVNKEERNEPIVAARLVTVLVPDKEGTVHSVTRVALATWDYEEHVFNDEQVIDFSIAGIEAWERNDVDFDFDSAPKEYRYSYEDSDYAFIGITSVIRPDEETVEAYEQQQFVTIVEWNVDAAHRVAMNTLCASSGFELSSEFAGYATSCPRVLMQCRLSDFLNTDNTPAVPFLYYYKTDVSTGATSLNVSAFYFDEVSRWFIYDLVLLEEKDLPDGLSSADLRHGTFEVYTLDRGGTGECESDYWTEIVIGWTGRNSSLPTPEGMSDDGEGAPYSFLRSFEINNYGYTPGVQLKGSLDLPNVSSLKRRTVEDGVSAPFVYHDDLSQAEKMPYKMVKVDESSLALSVSDAEGSTRMNRYFTSHDGKWLYTVRAVKHDVPGLSDASKASVAAGGKVYSNVYRDDDNYGDVGDVSTGGGQVESYQLMEARWHDGLDSYYQFYPIAQLDFCPDNAQVVNHADGRRDFIFTTIAAVDKTDTATRYELDEEYDMDSVYHVADVYHVAVPHALGLHVKNLKVTSPYATVGEAAYLMVELANTGNWYITGFDVDFFGPDDELIATTTFNDLEKRVQDTHQNYAQVLDDDGVPSYDDDGTPQSEQQQSRFDKLGMLAPGCTRTYRIEFTVPEGLEGNTDFSLQIKNPRCEPGGARSEYIDRSDLQVMGELAYVDPNVHGVSGSDAGDVEHVWTFNSKGAPYAVEGEDPQPEKEHDRGDVNANGQVNIVDAQLAYDIACNQEGITGLPGYEAMKKRAEVNGDGMVDAADALAIQNAIHHGWE